MARSAKFRIWESRNRFYRETMIGKRNVKRPDQHFTSLKGAIASVTEEWIGYAKALGVYGKHSKATFLATHPVPWAPGSLRPPVHAQRAKIKRHAAVQKIIEGATIGKTSLKAPPSKPVVKQRRVAVAA